MPKIANKLAELTQRVADIEAQIALHGQQTAFLEQHGRPHASGDQTIAGLQKRLVSLKRSCQILARHA